MTAPAMKRPRGRPRVRIPVAAPSSPAAAVAALELADKRELELDGSDAPPAQIAGPQTAAEVRAPDARPKGPRPPASDERDRSIPLSGKKYQTLNRDQLRTALAISDNERAELRAQLSRAAPVAAAATDEMLQRACGETFAAVAGMLALKFGDELRLAERDRDALGGAWAPVVAQYMREHPDSIARHAPLLAALSVTAGVTVEKVFAVRAKRAAAQAAPV